MRILHVLGRMERGGAETWLMHVFRSVDPKDFHMDFLVHTSDKAAFDDEIRNAGSLVIPCPDTGNPLQYARNFRRIVREKGPYDIVHSHVHFYSGYVLWVARSAGVWKRIAHSHIDTRGQEVNKTARRAYLSLMRRMLYRYADVGLAVSRKAAEDLFGPDWERDPRWRLLYCGIDLEPFREAVDPGRVRAELGIPENAFIVGHVGRFDEQKNHSFVIDVFSEVAGASNDIYLLLVGDGYLREGMEEKAESLGLKDRVVFTGVRPDVPRLMLGAMDVFIMPSLYEGLPLVLMEAQAAGLPCVFSDSITDEAGIVEHLVKRLPIDGPAATWAETILDLRRGACGPRDPGAVTVVEKSAFNIESSVEELIKVYECLD